MRSIFKSKKGISPILATLLLIVIAVAAVIVTYAWVMTFTGSTTNQAGAILTVENIRFYTNSTGTDYVEVVIRNAGTADAKIAEVYAGSSSSDLTTQNSLTYNPPTRMVNGGSSLSINIQYAWTEGTRYYFKIATEAGQTLPFNELA